MSSSPSNLRSSPHTLQPASKQTIPWNPEHPKLPSKPTSNDWIVYQQPSSPQGFDETQEESYLTELLAETQVPPNRSIIKPSHHIDSIGPSNQPSCLQSPGRQSCSPDVSLHFPAGLSLSLGPETQKARSSMEMNAILFKSYDLSSDQASFDHQPDPKLLSRDDLLRFETTTSTCLDPQPGSSPAAHLDRSSLSRSQGIHHDPQIVKHPTSQNVQAQTEQQGPDPLDAGSSHSSPRSNSDDLVAPLQSTFPGREAPSPHPPDLTLNLSPRHSSILLDSNRSHQFTADSTSDLFPSNCHSPPHPSPRLSIPCQSTPAPIKKPPASLLLKDSTSVFNPQTRQDSTNIRPLTNDRSVITDRATTPVIVTYPFRPSCTPPPVRTTSPTATPEAEAVHTQQALDDSACRPTLPESKSIDNDDTLTNQVDRVEEITPITLSTSRNQSPHSNQRHPLDGFHHELKGLDSTHQATPICQQSKSTVEAPDLVERQRDHGHATTSLSEPARSQHLHASYAVDRQPSSQVAGISRSGSPEPVVLGALERSDPPTSRSVSQASTPNDGPPDTFVSGSVHTHMSDVPPTGLESNPSNSPTLVARQESPGLASSSRPDVPAVHLTPDSSSSAAHPSDLPTATNSSAIIPELPNSVAHSDTNRTSQQFTISSSSHTTRVPSPTQSPSSVDSGRHVSNRLTKATPGIAVVIPRLTRRRKGTSSVQSPAIPQDVPIPLVPDHSRDSSNARRVLAYRQDWEAFAPGQVSSITPDKVIIKFDDGIHQPRDLSQLRLCHVRVGDVVRYIGSDLADEESQFTNIRAPKRVLRVEKAASNFDSIIHYPRDIIVCCDETDYEQLSRDLTSADRSYQHSRFLLEAVMVIPPGPRKYTGLKDRTLPQEILNDFRESMKTQSGVGMRSKLAGPQAQCPTQFSSHAGSADYIFQGFGILLTTSGPTAHHEANPRTRKRTPNSLRELTERQIRDRHGTVINRVSELYCLKGIDISIHRSSSSTKFKQPTPSSSEESPYRLSPSTKHQNHRTILLLAEAPTKTFKYLMALALGIPCVSTKWVTHSCEQGYALDWEKYMIGPGPSAFLAGAPPLVNLQVPLIRRTEHHLMAIFESLGSLQIFRNKSFVYVSSKPKHKSDWNETVRPILCASGATRVGFIELKLLLPNLLTVSEIGRQDGEEDEEGEGLGTLVDYILLEDQLDPDPIRRLLRTSKVASQDHGTHLPSNKRRKLTRVHSTNTTTSTRTRFHIDTDLPARLVDFEWLKQCLIVGRILRPHLFATSA